MGYEVDFLRVGDGKHGGDAIALRLGEIKSGDRNSQFVAIVDGGYKVNGGQLVNHVREHFGTNEVEVVLSTHLDHDHIAGLFVVIEELEVAELWMHEPTEEEQALVAAAFEEAQDLRHGRSEALERLATITASIGDSQSLADRARDLDIPIVHPFVGTSTYGGAFEIIGPTAEYYAELVPQFRTFKQSDSYRAMIASGLEAKGIKLPESLENELLEEGSKTEPENNSSAITLIRDGGRSILLTGDAGEEALARAADHLDESGFDWSSLKVMQIPHHGSRKNVTPTILNRYLGAPVQRDRERSAYACTPKSGRPHYPAKRVTNAFHRRGFKVYDTSGGAKRASHDAPDREGYDTAEEVPFFDEVD